MDGIDQNKTGLLVLVSSPSGGGKSTVIRELLKDSDFKYSVSMTTRKPRGKEKNGTDYWFVEKPEFDEKIAAGQLLEYELVHDHYYGTPKGPIEEWLEQGKVVLVDIDVKGAMQVKDQYKDQCLLIFLKPPDLETLKKRLVNRSTETEKQIERRLQRMDKEYEYAVKFDHIIVNNHLDKTVSTVRSIIEQKKQTI